MDWIQFLDSNHIYYRDHGSNVSHGQVVLHCPWCGNEDTGEHLSINLNGKGFRCWRNPVKHSGRNPTKLVQALLNCSWEQAERLAGQRKSLPSDFMGKMKSLFTKPEIVKRLPLKLPKEFKQLYTGLPSSRPYLNYLVDRGFSKYDFARANDYGMYYSTQGIYKGRIIFTVQQDDELVGWTGRTIYPTEQLRYKTLTNDTEKAEQRGEIPAPNPISHYLLFADRLFMTSADTIVLCEGPFDAWRVNLLGETEGVVATCFFTSMLSKQQLNLLHEILPRFRNRFLLLDQKTFTKSAQIRSDLVALNVEVRRLPAEFKDPAELRNAKQLKSVLAIV